MTIEEFSNEFDTLVSSYRRFKALDKMEMPDSIEFNEYEKSAFLTQAQEDIVKELYAGKYSSSSFEKTEEERRYLDQLVKQRDYKVADSSETLTDSTYKHTVYTLPEDCWYIVYEQAKWSETVGDCLFKKIIDVVPVSHDEYWRTINNPFRNPNNKRILRLDKGAKQVELVSKNPISEYIIRYLSAPSPIVLTYLPDESIAGVNTPQGCKLPDSLHHDILDRAVRLALQTKVTSNNKSEKKE